jgi:hypothetical protein
MSKEAAAVYVKGKQLRCPVCDGDRFVTHTTNMSSHGWASLLDWRWAGKRALNYLCVRCGYIFWFLPLKEKD